MTRSQFYENRYNDIKNFYARQRNIKYKTIDKFSNSSFIFNYTSGNLFSLFALLVFIFGLYKILILDFSLNNINVFEDGISFLQLCSNVGSTLKESYNDYLLSIANVKLNFELISSSNPLTSIIALFNIITAPISEIYNGLVLIFRFLYTFLQLLYGCLLILMG